MKLGDCHFHILTFKGKVSQLVIGKFPDRVKVMEWANDSELYQSPLAGHWRRQVFDRYARREHLIDIEAIICPPDGEHTSRHYLVNRASGSVTDLLTGKVIGRDW